MGVLYRPIKAKYKQLYEIEDYKADELVMEEMKRLPLDVVFGAKWGWYHAIYQLAKGDVTRFDEVTRQQAHKCLTLLNYEKDKAEAEKEQMNRR